MHNNTTPETQPEAQGATEPSPAAVALDQLRQLVATLEAHPRLAFVFAVSPYSSIDSRRCEVTPVDRDITTVRAWCQALGVEGPLTLTGVTTTRAHRRYQRSVQP